MTPPVTVTVTDHPSVRSVGCCEARSQVRITTNRFKICRIRTSSAGSPRSAEKVGNYFRCLFLCCGENLWTPLKIAPVIRSGQRVVVVTWNAGGSQGIAGNIWWCQPRQSPRASSASSVLLVVSSELSENKVKNQKENRNSRFSFGFYPARRAAKSYEEKLRK